MNSHIFDLFPCIYAKSWYNFLHKYHSLQWWKALYSIHSKGYRQKWWYHYVEKYHYLQLWIAIYSSSSQVYMQNCWYHFLDMHHSWFVMLCQLWPPVMCYCRGPKIAWNYAETFLCTWYVCDRKWQADKKAAVKFYQQFQEKNKTKQNKERGTIKSMLKSFNVPGALVTKMTCWQNYCRFVAPRHYLILII